MSNKSLIQEYAEVKWGYRMEISEYVSKALYEEHPERDTESILGEFFDDHMGSSWEEH